MYDFIFSNGFENDRNPIFWDITRRAVIINNSQNLTDYYCTLINWAYVNALFDHIILDAGDNIWPRGKPFNRQTAINFITALDGWR